MTRLKDSIIKWAREKKIQDEATLNKIEIEIERLLGSDYLGFQSTKDKDHLIQLEMEKAKLLRQQEETWRLKSMAIWLKAGDENCKLFHQCAKGRKSINTIWELKDQAGRVANNHAQLVDMGIRHFSHLYSDSIATNI